MDGYLIYTPKASEFEINKFITIFIYKLVNDYNNKIFGFKHFKEKLLFSDPIQVSCIGQRTAKKLFLNANKICKTI